MRFIQAQKHSGEGEGQSEVAADSNEWDEPGDMSPLRNNGVVVKAYSGRRKSRTVLMRSDNQQESGRVQPVLAEMG